MLKIYQLVIDATETAGEHFRYLGVKTAYVYRNGQPTTEIKGYRVTLALVERGYNTLDVTIPQPPGDILMYGTLADVKAFRRCAHGSVVFQYILPQLDRAFLHCVPHPASPLAACYYTLCSKAAQYAADHPAGINSQILRTT